MVLVENLPDRFHLVGVSLDFDLARFQRPGEGAGESPARGRDDVVERRRAGRKVRWRNAVVLRHLGVNPKCDRGLFGREVSQPLRTSKPFDLHS
jgi:hypothetical protein